jgi:hypothetical protein
MSPDEMRVVPLAQSESVKEEYPGTFDDYLEMAIQFGYVFLFGKLHPILRSAPCELSLQPGRGLWHL